MARVKRGTIKNKTRRNVLSKVKGYRFGRSTKERSARVAIDHAGRYAFTHRRDKKGVNRALWQIKLNAALRPLGYSYSKFIDVIKKKGIELDRKVMSQMAEHNPESFERFVKSL